MRKAWLLAILSAGLVTAAKAHDDSSPAPSPAVSATPRPPAETRLNLNLTDGSRIIGVPSVTGLGMATDYATLKLQVSAIRTIKITGSDSSATTTLANGDLITGHLNVKALKLNTVFGPVDVPVADIREIQVTNSSSAYLPDGLVLHYIFSGPGDKVTDSSPTGADGDVHGAVYTPDGKPSGGMKFDGGPQAIDLGNPAALQVQNLTVAMWIKRDNPDSAPYQNGMAELFGYGSHGYSFGLFSNGRLFLTKMETGNVSSNAIVNDASFHHVAVSRQDRQVVFYVDGVAFPAGNLNMDFDFDTNAAVGSCGDTHINGFIGTIGELEVFNRALSADEIKGIYDAQK